MLDPDLPLDEFHLCPPQRWRTGEIIDTVLSIAYGTPFSSFNIHVATANIFTKDTSAFFIVVYSTRHRRLMRAYGVRSLLDTIVEDATVYFLIIFAGHLLVIFLEFFAPVSDHPADLCCSTHGGLHVGRASNPCRKVSHHLEHHDKEELDGMLSYL